MADAPVSWSVLRSEANNNDPGNQAFLGSFSVSGGQYNFADRGIPGQSKGKSSFSLFQRERMGDFVVQVHLAFLYQLDHFLELAVLQPGTTHIQLLGSDGELLDGGFPGGKAHGDHPACTAIVVGSIKIASS